MPNVELGFGRTKEIKLNLDVQVWMFSARQFHVFMAFGTIVEFSELRMYIGLLIGGMLFCR